MLDDPVLLNDWHAVARASELKEGQVKPARLLGQDLVVWRGQGGVHAWLDLCIHRGAKLSRGHVAENCLVCPYHAWTYGEDGQCTKIPAHPALVPPAKAHTTVYHAAEKYDLVWVCLGTPAKDILTFPEWDNPSYRTFSAGPYLFKALGPRLIENFLDVGHLPIVHAGLLGDAARPEIQDYEVETTAEGVIARDIPIWQPSPDGVSGPAIVNYTYQVLRPLTARFTKAQGEQNFAMVDTVTPVSKEESLAWVILAYNYGFDVPAESILEFQNAITLQDIPVVESQRPELLPLDMQAELHLRSDRTAIAYRQWLKKIGLKYGTS